MKKRRSSILLGMFAFVTVASAMSTSAAPEARANQMQPGVQACLESNEASIKLRKDKKLRDARAQLLICASASCPTEIREECARRMPDVTAAVPSIIFAATNGAGADLAEVSVAMDGQPFAARLDGSALEVDPGEHTFVFESPGQPTTEKKIVIREGEKNRREQVMMGAPVAPTPPPPPNNQQANLEKPDRFPLTPLRIVGIGAVGLGALALGIGAALGLSARSQRDDSGCVKNVCDDAAAAGKLKDAVNTATVATGFFVAGGVLAAGGIALFVFAPNPNPNTNPNTNANPSPAEKPAQPPPTPPPPAAQIGIRMLAAGAPGLSVGGTW